MTTEPVGQPATFDFEGFTIPVDLAVLTGGGEDTWAGISQAHQAAYERYTPVRSGHDVLEVGCGVGRDAIPLATTLGADGSYLGVDISGPSISWCQDNITPRYPWVTFEHLDIRSDFYNPGGTLGATDIRIPLGQRSVDRIILQSVFTHMFEDDIVHFLTEFRRVLRSDGLVFASFFVLDDESVRLAAAGSGGLKFQHPWADGCRINDPDTPEGAVGYTSNALDRMLRMAGLDLAQPVHHGSWSGRPDVPDGQDIAILKRSAARGPWPGRVRRALRAG
jgi:SAM-dependent methyltransferase